MKRIKGLYEHRFKNNPLEKRFADAWHSHNELGKTLSHLLDSREIHMGCPPTPTDRESVVGATVIQWLGSPVGEFFLKEVGFVNVKPVVPTKKTALPDMRDHIETLARNGSPEVITAMFEAYKAVSR